jgi:hypothetical protein
VHLSRSPCTNIAWEVWRAAGTGVRQTMCWQSSLITCVGSTGSAIGVSSLLGILRGLPYMSSDTDVCRFPLNAVAVLEMGHSFQRLGMLGEHLVTEVSDLGFSEGTLLSG